MKPGTRVIFWHCGQTRLGKICEVAADRDGRDPLFRVKLAQKIVLVRQSDLRAIDFTKT